MKKISSALLFVSLLASSNAGAAVKEHFGNNWGKYTTGTVTLAAVGSAIYYDYKYNDSDCLNKASDYLNKAKELIKNNPKAAAGIVAAVVATSGIAVDLSRGSEKSGIRRSGRWTAQQAVNAKNGVVNGAVYTKNGVVNGAVNTKNTVKGWFTKTKNDGDAQAVVTPQAVQPEEPQEVNTKNLSDLNLGGRIMKNLANAEITTIDELVTALNGKIVGIGRASVEKIKAALNS